MTKSFSDQYSLRSLLDIPKPTRRPLRKGTALVDVEDESESEGEDEKSALPNLEELLREQSHIQLNVGAEKAWDGDTVSEFRFGCLRVGRARASPEHNGVVFAGAGDELFLFTVIHSLGLPTSSSPAPANTTPLGSGDARARPT